MEPGDPRSTPPVDLTKNVFHSPKERLIEGLLGLCALLSVATTLGIAGVLLVESAAFFAQVSPLRFLTESQWTPQFVDKHFGIWPLLSGTLLITAIAALLAIPIGVASAIYIAEYAPNRARKILKPGLELLAGVPTVVYGYFALTFVTPLLQQLIPGLGVYNALSGGLVVALPGVEDATARQEGDAVVFGCRAGSPGLADALAREVLAHGQLLALATHEPTLEDRFIAAVRAIRTTP